MKKAILILLILMCAIGSQAQTTYDRKQDKRIDTLSFAIVNLLAKDQQKDQLIKAQDSTIKALINGIVKSNQIVSYSPIYWKDSIDVNNKSNIIKVNYFKQ